MVLQQIRLCHLQKKTQAQMEGQVSTDVPIERVKMRREQSNTAQQTCAASNIGWLCYLNICLWNRNVPAAVLCSYTICKGPTVRTIRVTCNEAAPSGLLERVLKHRSPRRALARWRASARGRAVIPTCKSKATVRLDLVNSLKHSRYADYA